LPNRQRAAINHVVHRSLASPAAIPSSHAQAIGQSWLSSINPTAAFADQPTRLKRAKFSPRSAAAATLAAGLVIQVAISRAGRRIAGRGWCAASRPATPRSGRKAPGGSPSPLATDPSGIGTEVSIAAGAGKRTLSGAADGMVVIRSTGQSLASPAEELDFG
jgi:hypothetical protein